MKLIITLLLSCCLLLRTQVSALPGGAPPSACYTMLPIHPGTQPQTSDPPYQFLASNGQGRIRLILGSQQGKGYEGFIITARDANTGELVGKFSGFNDKQARHVECSPGEKNAVTHVKATEMFNLEVDWEAPQDYEGIIVFNSTICETYESYWVGVESPRINVTKRSIEIPTTPAYQFPTTRATTPPYYSPPTETQQVISPSSRFYEECGNKRICFGVGENCVARRNCEAMASVLVEGDRYKFELHTLRGKYVAVGISETNVMGDDSVVECVNNDNGQVTLHMSWNEGKRNIRIPTPPNSIELLKSDNRDGILSCTFSRNRFTTIEGKTFDLADKSYHLLVATGSSLKPTGIGYHDIGKDSTGEPRKLSDIGELAAASDLWIRVHGALMLASWIGTASIGMLLARYYRQTWVASQLCGKDQWFAWHRFFMILTWIMTLVAAGFIVYQIGGWSTYTLHASLGVATTVLCFVQPFMAAFRPHPGAPKRVLFNWLHWFVGNAAHICGLISIFFAVQLPKAKLPIWVDWVLVAFVVFHVVTHFFLTIAGCVSDRQGSQRVNSFPMKDVHARNAMAHTESRRDASHTGLRRLTFGIYFVVVALFTAALIVMVVLAPIEDTWNDFYKMVMG